MHESKGTAKRHHVSVCLCVCMSRHCANASLKTRFIDSFGGSNNNFPGETEQRRSQE